MSEVPYSRDRSSGLLSIDWFELASGARAGKFTLGARAKLITIGVSLIIALNMYSPASPTLMQRALATATIAACFLPTWLWMDKTDRSIPFLSFIAVFYAFFYAVPVFLLRKFSADMFKDPQSTHDINLALGYALLGLISMYAGYYGIAGRGVAEMIPKFNLRWRNERIVKLVSLTLAIGGLVLSSSSMQSRVPQQLGLILAYAGDFSLIGISSLVALQLTGRLDRGTSVLVWGVLAPLRFLVGVGGGLGGAIAVGIMIVVLYATIRRQIPWLIFAAGITVVFILRPIETPYRAMTSKGGPLADASSVQRLESLGDLIYRATVGGAVPASVFIEACSSRLAQFTIFASVIHDTPARVPYWNGETYVPLLTKLIPRFVYPDKPQELSGQTFGHRYGLISNANTDTSVNLPQLVECYANFGVPGVVIGMFMIGMLYRAVIGMYVHPGMGMGALIGAIYVSARIFDIGTAASMVLGGLPWDMLAVAIFHLVVEAAEIDSLSLVPHGRSV